MTEYIAIIKAYIKQYVFFSLLITGFLIYGNSLINDFILDDRVQIVGNPLMHSIGNLPKFFTGSTYSDGFANPRGNYYRPMMSIMYSTLYSLFGAAPFPFHFVLIFIYCVNAWLVYKFLLHFFSFNISLFGAFIYLVHPINSEIATYIANMQDVLFFLFGMLGLNIYISKKYNHYNLLVVFGMFFLSVMAKEAGILFIALLLTYQWFYDRRKVIISLGLTFTIGAMYAILKLVIAQMHAETDLFSPMMRLPLNQRVLHIPLMIVYYLKQFFFPVTLVTQQNWIIKSLNANNFYIPLAVVLLFLAAIVLGYIYLCKTKESKKQYLVFALWFIGSLSLYMQFHPLDMTVADHWFYVPMLGLLGMLFTIKLPIIPKNYSYVAACILLTLLSWKSFIRTFDYRNEYTISKHDLAIQDDNFVLHHTYGLALLERGDMNAAEKQFLAATKIDPGNNISWNNLGYIYEQRGKQDKKHYKKADEYYTMAIKTGTDPTSYINLAALRIFREQLDHKDTNEFLEKALKTMPNNPRLRVMHAITLYKLNNKTAALIEAQKALQIQPYEPLNMQVYNIINSGGEMTITE